MNAARTRRAEEALLGAALHRPASLPSMRWLPAGAFASPELGALWSTLQSLDLSRIARNDIPAAVTAAVAQLEDQGVRTLLTPTRLGQIAGACPDPATAPLYGGMVVESAIHRSVEHAGQQLQTAAEQADTDQARPTLDQVTSTGNRLGALGAAWTAVPETVRTLLDTPAEAPLHLASRTGRLRTDPQAEHDTVASLLRQPGQLPEVTSWLRAKDFSDPRLGAAYQAMAVLDTRHAPIDPLTVGWELARRPGPQPSDQLLAELEQSGTGGGASFFGAQVLGTAALDRLHTAASDLRSIGRHPQLAPTAVLDSAQAALQPAAADRDRLHQVEHSREMAPADQEPAPAAHAPEMPSPDHEMEMDL
ncbi:DnaB-like helicase N-terminal domain-containing protein [Streptomyces xanthochromogenes]|uniref:DnaB-like helicase N-terminal domain-containing protein n=1 Tax=Streptomyces xanthochromogenes TaxID=67384 RepID=UPI003811CD1B